MVSLSQAISNFLTFNFEFRVDLFLDWKLTKADSRDFPTILSKDC